MIAVLKMKTGRFKEKKNDALRALHYKEEGAAPKFELELKGRRESSFCVMGQEHVCGGRGAFRAWKQGSMWSFLTFYAEYWATVFSFLIRPAF